MPARAATERKRVESCIFIVVVVGVDCLMF